MSTNVIERPDERDEQRQALRTAYHSITEGGLRQDSLPMRLFLQGARKHWDPADIDYSEDKAHWELLDDSTKEVVLSLATMFIIGEESVTEDIQPFMRAMAAEGRFEDEMYLTQFAYEEAKHVQVFRNWLDAVGATRDLHDIIEMGMEHTTKGVLSTGPGGIFSDMQPEAMRRLEHDHSPQAQIRANVIYNQYVEGTLALTGYWAWSNILQNTGGFPGMQEIIRRLARDERRHLAWGTYNIRRHVAADDAMWDYTVACLDEMKERMYELERVRAETVDPEQEAAFGAAMGVGPEERFQYQIDRLNRRYGAIESARGQSQASIEQGTTDDAVGDDEGYDDLAAE
jgi:ribonucleoside-diphosphate reductase beta chain